MSKNQNKVEDNEEKVILENETENNSVNSEAIEDSVEQESEPSLESQLAESKDKFVRLYADFENYRRNSNKEKVDLISNANAGMLKDLLPIVDVFERAIQENEKVEDLNALREGFQLIFNKLKTTLESKGLKAMESQGEMFDSELHEAIANIPAPSEDLKGKVIDDVEKGYYLNTKVIRFAKVVVGQ